MPTPHVIGVLLAAGASRRFGDEDKLMAMLNGRALLEYAASALLSVLPDNAFAVVPPGPSARAERLQGLGLSIVEHADCHDGLGSSIACAARLAVARKADAFLLVLGDMPLVTSAHLAKLVSSHRSGATIGTDPGQPPVIFAKRDFAALMRLSGDRGAKEILRGAQLLHTDDALLSDVDTPQQLVAIKTILDDKKYLVP